MNDLKFTTAGDYMENRDTFTEQMDYHTEYGKTFGADTVWSIYDEGIMFDDDHPFGKGVVIRHKSDFIPYDVKVPVRGKTWGDIWKAADEAIVESGDKHHIFIEGFENNGMGELTVFTGS